MRWPWSKQAEPAATEQKPLTKIEKAAWAIRALEFATSPVQFRCLNGDRYQSITLVDLDGQWLAEVRMRDGDLSPLRVRLEPFNMSAEVKPEPDGSVRVWPVSLVDR